MEIEVPTFKFALREDIKDEVQFLPSKAEPFATGYDVRAALHYKKSLVIEPYEYVRIPLGFRSFCPDGWWYQLHPRSSSFAKKHLHSLIGIIDLSWEGETQFACQYVPCIKNLIKQEYGNGYESPEPYYPKLTINYGDALGQLIPVKLYTMKVEQVSNEEYDLLCKQRNGSRGAGGFGSTG